MIIKLYLLYKIQTKKLFNFNYCLYYKKLSPKKNVYI